MGDGASNNFLSFFFLGGGEGCGGGGKAIAYNKSGCSLSLSRFLYHTSCLCHISFPLCMSFLYLFSPGAVAQSDARPPGMRSIAGSFLPSGNILS